MFSYKKKVKVEKPEYDYVIRINYESSEGFKSLLKGDRIRDLETPTVNIAASKIVLQRMERIARNGYFGPIQGVETVVPAHRILSVEFASFSDV